MATKLTSGKSSPSLKQVDPDQHVDRTVPQFPQDFDAVEGFDVRVNVPAFDAQPVQVLREFLCHAFGQGGDQHTFVFSQGFPNLHNKVVHLVVARPDFNGRVEESSGSNDLLDHHPFSALELKVGRGGADINGLVDDAVELLLVGQRAVVQGRRQSESVVDERDFAGTVPAKHGPNLWHRHVTLVDDHQEVLGEVVQQTERPFTGLSSVEIPGVILNAGTEPNFPLIISKS